MKPISEAVNQLIRRILVKKDPILTEIIINWAKIVGHKFSKNTAPMKITRGFEKNSKVNILHIETSNPSLSMEMAFQQDIIIERMTIYLGFKAIHKLKLILI